MDVILQYVPIDGIKILLTFLLSFLIGFEREEHYTASKSQHFMGGVRTFPLIGLLGYVIATISEDDSFILTAGLLVLGGFMLLSYRHKLEFNVGSGITSEVSGIFTYFIGVLVYREQFWIATTLVIVTALLLELKKVLEDLARKIPEEEIFTFTKFLFLTAVILPILPRREFTLFNISPFQTWLVVVAISGVSYIIYVLGRLLGPHQSLLLSALLGGAYSSTITTLALARGSHKEGAPAYYAGALLMASGMMYLRLLLLIAIFNVDIAHKLMMLFLVLGCLGIFTGALWIHQHKTTPPAERSASSQNPLEIRTAFLFTLLFLAMMVASKMVKLVWGNIGIYGLSILTGLTDIDPFIMGLAQTPGVELSVDLAAKAILIASISNNFIKGLYVLFLAEKRVAQQGAAFLFILAICGLLGFWLFL